MRPTYILIALLAGMVGGMVGTTFGAKTAQGAPSQYTASRITIVDETGTPRAVLGVFKGVAGLTLMDEQRTPRAIVAVEANGTPSIGLLGTDTKVRLGMDVYHDGATRLTFTRPDGTAAAGLLMSPDGQGVIMIKDGNGKVLWSAPPGLE